MQAIAAIILAAGEARRMGQAKQLLPYQGQTLLGRCIQLAQQASLHPIIVVTGARREAIQAAHTEFQTVFWVHNPLWESGMGSSLQCGLQAVPPQQKGAHILLADQPRISLDHLQKQQVSFSQTGVQLVSTQYPHGPGVPAIFHQALFPELLALPPQTGARKFLRQKADSPYHISIPAGQQYIDIDTPDDYQQLLESEP